MISAISETYIISLGFVDVNAHSHCITGKFEHRDDAYKKSAFRVEFTTKVGMTPTVRCRRGVCYNMRDAPIIELDVLSKWTYESTIFDMFSQLRCHLEAN